MIKYAPKYGQLQPNTPNTVFGAGIEARQFCQFQLFCFWLVHHQNVHQSYHKFFLPRAGLWSRSAAEAIANIEMKPTATKVHSRNAWIWYFKYLSLEWGGWFEIFRPRCRTGNLNLNRNRNILRLRWSYPQLFSSAALHPLISSEIDEPQANWTEKKNKQIGWF